VPATEAIPIPTPAPRARARLTWALLAANVGVFALLEATGSSSDVHDLVRFGALEPGLVRSGEPWRLLSAAFLHSGWLHLAVNVVAAFPLARAVERAAGPIRLAAFWAGGALAGFALSALGRDAVSVGASGALHGVLGAALVLHGLALGSLRAFLRSGLTRLVALSLAAWAGAGLFLSLPLDHLAHGGGLAAGAVLALALAARPPRRTATAAAAVGIVLLCAAAAWPRGAPSRYQAESRTARIHAALRRLDRDEARRLLAEAEASGQRGADLDYYRGLLRLQEGDLEGALAILRPLAAGPPGAVREEARARAASAARVLGLRHAFGFRARKDPRLGLAYLDEACALGDAESCRRADSLRGEIAR
jgi:rhomboid protease GluP